MKISRRFFLWTSGLGSLFLFFKKARGTKIPFTSSKISSPDSTDDVWIELNLENMGWNLKQVRKLVKTPVMAVIKANAYGHGLTEAGNYLERNGIDSLMVGKFQEAVQLREAGVSCPIHNFGPLFAADTDWLVEFGISQSVFTDRIETLNSSALRVGKKAKVHVHVDTGMGRMGIPYQEAFPYVKKNRSTVRNRNRWDLHNTDRRH